MKDPLNFNERPYPFSLQSPFISCLGPLFDRVNVMTETTLKCTTRHVRLYTARLENDDLVFDRDHLTLDLDPDNEFLQTEQVVQKVQQSFVDLVNSYKGRELSDYNLRRIGSALEGTIRQLLQAGELSYNPDCRVLNYSMGLPRTPDLL